jgi:hypothetical protein
MPLIFLSYHVIYYLSNSYKYKNALCMSKKIKKIKQRLGRLQPTGHLLIYFIRPSFRHESGGIRKMQTPSVEQPRVFVNSFYEDALTPRSME